MDQILLKKPYAESRVISASFADKVSDDIDNALRIYRDSPYTILIQTRTRKNGSKQKRVTNVTITKQQAKDIAAFLLATAEGLSEERVGK